MRPIPAKRHHWAVAVLIAVAAANAALTFRQSDISDPQANLLAEAFKRGDPGLYASDETFGPAGAGALWRMHLPAWQWVLSAAGRLGGSADPLNALRILGTAALSIYLLGMYALLYRQTHSSSAATLVAAMSMAIFSVKRPYWGLGPMFAVTPATLYVAVVPLAAWGLLRLRRSWRLPAVFFLAGLCGNIHLPSAMNLVLVMALAVVAADRFRPRAWALAAASGAAAVVGAAPAIIHYCLTFRAAGISLPQMSISQLRGILQLAGVNVLYPDVLVQALRWLPVAVVLAAPAGIILSRAGRYRVRNLATWLWLLAGALLVAFGLQGICQVVGWRLRTLPPVIEFFDALRLAMLPLYVLFAQALVHLFRLARRSRAWLRAGVAVLAAVYLGSSYNTRPIRHLVRDAVAAVARQEQLPDERAGERAELRTIARWAGPAGHTHEDALFVCAEAELRLYARRSVLACPADLRYLYHLAPQRLQQWAEDVQAQRKLLEPPEGTPADADKIVAFVDTYWQRRGGPAAPTYVAIPARAAPLASARLREIAPPAESWGRRWRLFRVAPLPPGPT